MRSSPPPLGHTQATCLPRAQTTTGQPSGHCFPPRGARKAGAALNCLQKEGGGRDGGSKLAISPLPALLTRAGSTSSAREPSWPVTALARKVRESNAVAGPAASALGFWSPEPPAGENTPRSTDAADPEHPASPPMCQGCDEAILGQGSITSTPSRGPINAGRLDQE